MIEIVRDWVHIEDQIRPSFGRKIWLRVDIYTDDSILKIPLIKEIEENLLDLKIYGVNLGRELTFFEEDNYLIIDLGDLKNWTSIKNSRGLTKVRLDLNFAVKDPNFELSKMDLGYQSFFEIDGYKLDKSFIIVPPGLKIENDGEIEIQISKKCGEKKEEFKINSQADYVDKDNRRKKYAFKLKKEDRTLLKNGDCEISFKIIYRVVNERIYYLIAIIGFALLLVSLFRLYSLIIGSPELKFDIRFLAASVTFLGLYLSLIREGYELPFRKLVFISILLLLMELGLELIFLK